MYIYIHTCMHEYLHIYIHTHTHIYIDVIYLHTHTYIICMYVFLYTKNTHIYIAICILYKCWGGFTLMYHKWSAKITKTYGFIQGSGKQSFRRRFWGSMWNFATRKKACLNSSKWGPEWLYPTQHNLFGYPVFSGGIWWAISRIRITIVGCCSELLDRGDKPVI